jgi:hypothetical protein
VAHVVNFVANDMIPAQIVTDLPDLEPEDIRHLGGHPKPAIDGHLKTGHHA